MTSPTCTTCTTCRFFEAAPLAMGAVMRRKDQFDKPVAGECRRRAPLPPTRGQYVHLPSEGEWPVVNATAWCGEYEARDAGAPA